MAREARELDALIAGVAEHEDAEESIVILLGNLRALLGAAGTNPMKLAALTVALATYKEDMAAACVTNTALG
jgi:enamine deaminase RidA (YjgF/YER057c/UK114 family)